jgi:hypothetical protein
MEANLLTTARHAMAPLLVGALLVCGTACSGAPDEDVDVTSQAVSVHTVHTVTTISYAPNSYVIGNAYPGWHDDVQGDPQSSRGPGNWGGASYRWGFLEGEHFDRCAWIGDEASSGTSEISGHDRCGSPQQIDTPYFLRTYTDGIHNSAAGDGSLTHMRYAGSGCNNRNGYGNVDPWRVPAVPSNSRGVVADGSTLFWRYVSKDGKWVLVRDPSVDGLDSPNWYFVHRGCVSLEDGYEESE